MASLQPFFTKFISLFLLLVHLGCFIFPSDDHRRRRPPRKRKASFPSLSPQSPSRIKQKTQKALSSSWSLLKRIFTSKPNLTSQTHPNPTTPSPSSTRSSQQQSSIVPVIPPDTITSDPPRNRPTGSHPESEISADQRFFPLRNDIYPCPVCGEIFQKPNLLEHHQSIKHAVSELINGDSGNNIVRIIFKTGWPDKSKTPHIHRILKIQNSPKILTRFEEHRENVILKASRNGAAWRRDERCIADGNELLRFHCGTFLCELGQNGNSGICNHQYCSVCGIIRSGFSPKLDGISTLSTSWRAHVAIPEEIEEEFKFMHVRRAMLVCRVIAGRVGCDQEFVDKDDPGFDSVAGSGGGGGGVQIQTRLDEEDELLVFNPRAVLPCFVIIYTV